jgi:hypothetical protein
LVINLHNSLEQNMNRFFTRPRLLASAAALALSLGAAGAANAGALAQSVLQISDLLFISGLTGNTLRESDFSTLVAKDTTDGTATLNGTPATDSRSVSAYPFTLDMPQVCVGACTNGENDYSHRAAGYYPSTARTDTELSGDPLIFDNHGQNTASGANANLVGEVDLNAPGDGSTQANLGLQADFTFALNNTQAVTFTFGADGYLIADLGPQAAIPGSSAHASFNWSLGITDDSGNDIFDFSPNGVVDAGEKLDPCSLNKTIGRLTTGTSTYTCTGNFSATTPVLTAGTLYHFVIRHTGETDATKVTVPEPGTLVLLSAGLLGLGGTFKKRKSL